MWERCVRERETKWGRNNLDTNECALLEFKPLQGSCQSFKSGNLLQEAEAVSDLKDAVVSILPRVNFDTFLPALKHTHTISPIRKYCMQNKECKSDLRWCLFWLQTNCDTDRTCRINWTCQVNFWDEVFPSAVKTTLNRQTFPVFCLVFHMWFSCFPIPNGSLESVLTLIYELHMQHSLSLCHQLIPPSIPFFSLPVGNKSILSSHIAGTTQGLSIYTRTTINSPVLIERTLCSKGSWFYFLGWIIFMKTFMNCGTLIFRLQNLKCMVCVHHKCPVYRQS